MSLIGGVDDLLLAIAVRGTAILAVALVGTALLRRRGGAPRHVLWTMTMAALLALPLLIATLPALPLLPDVGVDLGPRAAALSAPRDGAGASDRDPDPAQVAGGLGLPAIAVSSAREGVLVSPRPVPSARRFDIGQAAFGIWALGALAILAALGRGLLRAHRLTGASAPLRSAAWQRDLDRLCRRLFVRRPVTLRVSHAVDAPLTVGVRHPAILLPAAAPGWDRERRRLVLAHELVHIRRADVARHLAVRVAAALYWCQPLIWLAARLAVLAREQACDDEVLALGHRPSAYARLLLELSAARPTPAVALGITHRPHLEKRLMAILDNNRNARANGLPVVVAVIMSALVVSIAAATPQTPPPPPPPAPGAAVATSAPLPTGTATPGAPTLPPPAGTVTPGAPAPPPPAATEAPGSRVPAPSVAAVKPAQLACFDPRFRGTSFRGSYSRSRRAGGDRYEAVGFQDGERVIQKYVDDTRLCLRIAGPVELSDDGARIEAMLGGGQVVMEAEHEGTLQRLLITGDGNGLQHDYSVDGQHAAFDETARAWRDSLLRVMAAYGEIGDIRGQVSTLRGKISSLHGQRSSLRGRISSIRGHVSSLNGEISSARGRVSSLRGQISSARGHVSSLRGRISSVRGHVSSLRGRISSLNARLSSLRSASRATQDEETRRRLEGETEEVREAIRESERQIEAWDADGKVDAIEREIEEYDLDGRVARVEREIREQVTEGVIADIEQQIRDYEADAKIAEVEREIEALDVETEVREIEAEIEALDAERRIEEAEARLEPELSRLERLLATARAAARG